MIQRLLSLKGRPRPRSLDKAHKSVQVDLGQSQRGSSPQRAGAPKAELEAQQPAVALASLHVASIQSESGLMAPQPTGLEQREPAPPPPARRRKPHRGTRLPMCGAGGGGWHSLLSGIGDLGRVWLFNQFR